MFGKLISSVSRYFFNNFASNISAKFKSLSFVLKNTNINEDINTYLSNILFVSLVFGILMEFLIIFLMLKLNILFSIFNFVMTIFIAVTFTTFIFIVLYRHPYFIVSGKKRELEIEIDNSIRHLSILQDSNLKIVEVLYLLSKLEDNNLFTNETTRIIGKINLTKNVKSVLEEVVDNTYSEIEREFFSKLIDVLNKKKLLKEVVSEFLITLDATRKEKSEQKKGKINLLFLLNIFLFFGVLIILITLFIVDKQTFAISKALFYISIIFPIIEFLLIIILNR
ncbi:MAG: type II secretion system F family protein [archaeon]